MKKCLWFWTTSILYLQMCASREGLDEWCNILETFCLFSEKKRLSVSNLNEAQMKCSETKYDSWPVELGDERVKEVFIEFIKNHSISNVILNALNRNGTWYWRTTRNESKAAQVDQNISSQDNNLIYNYSNSHSYAVVCMTSCRANWYDSQNSFVEDEEARFKDGMDFERCRELCEINEKCSSISWSDHNCWLHFYPYDVTKVKPRNDSSHHFVDRSVKRLEICIGRLSAPFPNFTGSGERRYVSKKPSDLIIILEVTLMLILLLILITITVAIGVMLCRRRRKKMKTVVRNLQRRSSELIRKKISVEVLPSILRS